MSEAVEKLNKVVDYLKGSFVDKDRILDLMGICLVAKENLFLFGPPGTAKSAMVKELAKSLDGKYFEYLLTRFTEPSELFGPFDIRKLKDGELITNTSGMLPEATLVFLDELLNANSAILNTLLMVLNERMFVRGSEKRKIPALMTVSASNHLPEDEALQALFDRFLVRVKCDNVDPEHLDKVLSAGWKLAKSEQEKRPIISATEILELQNKIFEVNLEQTKPDFVDLVRRLRNAGVSVSDRRAVKMQRLIAASAILCGRTYSINSDLWVLKYTWDNEEQIDVIAGIVDAIVSKEDVKQEKKKHPASQVNDLPDPDRIVEEVERMSLEWDKDDISPSERSKIKDRLRHINNQVEWITNEVQKDFVMKSINALWDKTVVQNAE